MKLAEALLLRAEYQNKLDNLLQRTLSNLKVQEGDSPHEDPQTLLDEATALNGALCVLVQRINRTNAAVMLPDGRSLADALADRDRLRKERSMLSEVTSSALERDYRLTHTEVRVSVALDVGAAQKRVDHLSRQYRELDTQLQGLNWTSDLLE